MLKVTADGGANRLRLRVLIARQVALEEVRGADEGVVGVELVRLAAEATNGLEAEHELGLGLHPPTLDLVWRRPLVREPLDLLMNGTLQRAKGMSGGSRGHKLKEGADLTGVL